MSVERSSVAGPPKSAGSGQVGHIKGKAHPTGGSAQGDTGDFSSLLMTLGTDEAGDLGVSQEATIQPLVGDGALLNPGLLLAQSMQLQPGLPKTAGVPGKDGFAPVDVTVQAAKTGPERGVDGLHSGPGAAHPTASELPVSEQNVDKLPVSTDADQKEKKEPPLARLGTPKPLESTDASQMGKSRFAAEEHANKLMHADNRMAQSSVLPQMALVAGIGEPGARQNERATERSAFRQIGGSEGGMWGHQALVEAGRIDAPAPTTEAAGLSPEMMVAEQVNYWIGRDVQNAELKLDGLGESPVKVSISLQGNEAHIEFRTDQAEARQVLEGAVSHLKDLLGNEGLVLSSVSVGSSGSRGDDPRERALPERGRQATVKVPEVSVGGAALRPARLSGRTVDLFV
jgi:flagellar hook-length control protein FliK